MEFYKYKCSDCGSTRFEKVENGYKCKYCGNIQDVIFTKEEQKEKDTASEEPINEEIQEINENENEPKSFKFTPEFKSALIRLLLCIFGGWFGLHKFIKGEIFWGIIYAITGGLFGVGYIIDIICYSLDLEKTIKTGGEKWKKIF